MMMDGVSGLCQRTKKNSIGTKNNEIYSWRRACAQTYGMVLSLRLLVFWKIPLLCANVSRVDSLVVVVDVVVVQNKVGTTTLDPKQALGWTFQSWKRQRCHRSCSLWYPSCRCYCCWWCNSVTRDWETIVDGTICGAAAAPPAPVAAAKVPIAAAPSRGWGCCCEESTMPWYAKTTDDLLRLHQDLIRQVMEGRAGALLAFVWVVLLSTTIQANKTRTLLTLTLRLFISLNPNSKIAHNS